MDSTFPRTEFLASTSRIAASAMRRGSIGTQADLEKVDILLVDDREENLIALEAVLSDPEYHLIRARSGTEALRYLLNHDPALILMDVQMPKMDGFETASVIKKNERTREIPIIFITAINKEEQYVHKGYDFGAVDYIHKPFDSHILQSKVAIFVDLYRKTKRLVRVERELRDSERKEREREIAQLELKALKREQADQKKYRDLVEGIDHGIVWSADAQSLAVSFVSPRAERILGYSMDRWAEEDFLLQVVHPDDRERLREAIRLARTGQADVGLEHRLMKADGTVAWLHTGIRMGAKSSGWGQELRGLSVEVTQLKNAEAAMAHSKKRSDFMAEASLILSQSLDYSTIFTRIGTLAVPRLADWYSIDLINEIDEVESLSAVQNPSVKEDLGSRMREVLSEPELKKVYSQVIATAQPRLFPQIMDQRSMMFVPLVARGKVKGAITFLSNVNAPVYNSDDLSMAEDLARRVAVAIDNARLYKQAQEAVRARDEFLSIASHELKTPLTPLKLQTQSLMRALASTDPNGQPVEVRGERISKMLHSADRQITKLTHLIDDLLDISRISMGGVNLDPEEFDLVELVRETVERFKEQLNNDQCEVFLEGVAVLPVFLDRFRIEQVVINLLTNAMKYGAGKPIVIHVEPREELGVRICFRDHGIGIEKRDQERIFHRFERAVSGTHFGGLGLGLYIVTQILAAHRGRILVESEPGVGSNFIVDLPVRV